MLNLNASSVIISNLGICCCFVTFILVWLHLGKPFSKQRKRNYCHSMINCVPGQMNTHCGIQIKPSMGGHFFKILFTVKLKQLIN